MSPILDRLRCAVRELRKGPRAPLTQQEIWETIPTSAFVNIVSQCTLADISSLSLTCHALHSRIYQNEYSISQEYLWRRKRWPQANPNGETDTASPGDDLTFISDLFPPPPPQYTDENMQRDLPGYSFGYLADLTRCWTTCVRLSYYLASSVVQQHLETDSTAQSLWASSEIERDVVYSKGVSLLQSRVLYPIAYLIFFLETYAASSPRTPEKNTVYSQRSLKTQQSILQRPPFTDTNILVATHHCMHLLCSTVRRMMTPDISYYSTANWLSLLLTTSTLERIVEFFTAAARDGLGKESRTPTPTWTQRMDFLWHMRNDLDKYLALRSGASGNRRPVNPELRDIWFGAAEMVMDHRGVLPHVGEEPVPIFHGSDVVLRCGYCDDDLDVY